MKVGITGIGNCLAVAFCITSMSTSLLVHVGPIDILLSIHDSMASRNLMLGEGPLLPVCGCFLVFVEILLNWP